MKARAPVRAADVLLDLQPMEARLVPHLPDDNVTTESGDRSMAARREQLLPRVLQGRHVPRLALALTQKAGYLGQPA